MSREHSFAAPIPVVSTAELRLRLERTRPTLEGPVSAGHPHPVPAALAFDADGTLWSGDVGFDLFKAALAVRALKPDARAALAAEAHAVGLSASADEDANEIALRLFAAWAAGDVSDERAFRMMAWAFAGFSEAEMLAFSAETQRASGLEARLHGPAREIIRWAHDEGIEVWIVSASPRAAVVTGARHFGIEPGRVIGVTPLVAEGMLTTELVEPISFDAGKPLALSAQCPLPVLAAFGDTASDVPLFLAARLAVAIGPNDRLRAAASSVPGLVELALV
jgi:phosphatidylglycerophosphatase C